MAKLQTITNSHLDVEIWDLDPSEGRGPFAVVQAGCDPGDDTAQDRFFLLRRDGVWVDISYYLVHPKSEALDEAVFDSAAEIIQLLEAVPSRPRVADLQASKEALLAWRRAQPQGEPGLAGFRRWVAEYRQRRNQRAAGARG